MFWGVLGVRWRRCHSRCGSGVSPAFDSHAPLQRDGQGLPRCDSDSWMGVYTHVLDCAYPFGFRTLTICGPLCARASLTA